MKNKLMTMACAICCVATHVVGIFIGMPLGKEIENKNFKQTLLDENLAEYDRKTGEWHLLHPNEIQGNLIQPKDRHKFTSIEDHMNFLETELILLRKQKAALESKGGSIKFDPKVIVSSK
jgi:hypothetical protein